ncbi:MAG: hypothetical protein IJV15_03450 [Lachnospiraceae bacterium]|nr:hypothetical protein [Lachnospiraceae bacterium]
MENIYQICFYGGLILAIILLIVSIILFVVFKIPKVIGDLTGRTAKREIEQKKKGRKNTPSEVSRAEQNKYYNQSSGKIKIRESATNDEIDKDPVKSNVIAPERETDILRPEDLDEDATAVLDSVDNEEETMVLESSDEEETDVLTQGGVGDDSPTDVLTQGGVGDDSPTDVLTQGGVGDDSPTDVLTQGGVGDDSPTDVLIQGGVGDDSPTDVLTSDEDEETTILSAESEKETTILSTDNNISTEDKDYVYNIVIINTDESL